MTKVKEKTQEGRRQAFADKEGNQDEGDNVEGVTAKKSSYDEHMPTLQNKHIFYIPNINR